MVAPQGPKKPLRGPKKPPEASQRPPSLPRCSESAKGFKHCIPVLSDFHGEAWVGACFADRGSEATASDPT